MEPLYGIGSVSCWYIYFSVELINISDKPGRISYYPKYFVLKNLNRFRIFVTAVSVILDRNRLNKIGWISEIYINSNFQNSIYPSLMMDVSSKTFRDPINVRSMKDKIKSSSTDLTAFSVLVAAA